MKELFKQIRLFLFSIFIYWAICVLPKDADKTWEWFTKMPIEK